MSLDRRGFLKGAAAYGLGLAGWQRPARASCASSIVWGELFPTATTDVGGWTCATFPGPFNILEIYMQGGASPWETFWLSGSITSGNLFDQHGLNSADLGYGQLNWPANSTEPLCQGTSVPSLYPTSYDEYQPFATQVGGEQIYWGAAAKPLWSRQDILKRCRMVTQWHWLPPHEAAVPFCLTGLTLGNARMAGTGAAIEHRVRALDPLRIKPASYVLYTSTPLALSPLAATGEHPGFARPVVIQVKSNDDFRNSLNRPNISLNQPEADDLFRALRHEYRDRLRYQGAGLPIRSAGFEGYWAAAELLENAPTLQQNFPPGLLVINTNPYDVKICPTHSIATPAGLFPGTKTMIETAASLLSSSGQAQARYVCVVDSGLARDYDTHGEAPNPYRHVLATCANQFDTLKHLADNIFHATDNPNGLLNLNETMVVITTEFGRSNDVSTTKGREHHPSGYVTVLIGGPIPVNNGAKIGGGIEGADGETKTLYRYWPTDVRGAMLLAAGIDPFASPGNFRENDFSPALLGNTDGSQQQIKNKLKELILGL